MARERKRDEEGCIDIRMVAGLRLRQMISTTILRNREILRGM